MKKLLSVILTAASLLALVSCGGTVAPAPVDSDTGAAEQTTAAPSFESRTATLSFDQLGTVPVAFADKSNGEFVTLSIGEKELSAVSVAPGEAEVTLTNNYSEEVEVAVTVDEQGSIKFDFQPFKAPAVSYIATDYGAKGNGATDSTAAIQTCIDRASAAGGGTVYVPAGDYRIATLSMKPGVTLRLAGYLADATVGYTDEVKAYATSKNYAVFKTSGSSRSNFFFLNTKLPQAYCTEGMSDFSIYGGMFDCEAKMKYTCIACGENIVFANTIVKDNPNNHSFQIEGCTNVVVKNFLFAGYYYPADAVLTRETIQIEPTTEGAIGSNYDTNAIQCKNGDWHYCHNVSVIGCYFGKSDKYGPHLVAVGHHAYTGGLTCDGFVFEGNYVDNPIYCGLHLLNISNATIKDNTFISDTKYGTAAQAADSALISLYTKDNAVTYTDTNSKKIVTCYKYELYGDRNYEITGNTLELGGGTFLKAFWCGSTTYDGHAEYVSSTSDFRVTEFGGTPERINGYVIYRNIIGMIHIADNKINVKSKLGYKEYFGYFYQVKGLLLENNELTLASDVDNKGSYKNMSGFYGGGSKEYDDCNRCAVKLSRIAQKKLNVVCGTQTWTAPKASSEIYLTITGGEHGRISMDTDISGNLTITLVPDSGWKLTGWKTEAGADWDMSVAPKTATVVVPVYAAE